MLTKRKLKKGILKNIKLVKCSRLKDKIFQTTFSCSLMKKYVQEDIEIAQEKVKLHNQKKKKIINIILLILNVFIIASVFIYYGLTSGIKSLRELIFENIAYQYLLVALGLFIFAIIVDTFRFYQLIKRTTGKRRFITSLNTHLIGRYYDSITPFAVGGQPFQISYLLKKDISGSKATGVILAKQFFHMTAFSLISLVVLISQLTKPLLASPIIVTLAFVALAINITVVSTILLLSLTKRVGPALIIKILKLLSKMHIIKNYKTTFFKVAKFVKNYQRSMKDFSKSAWVIICQLLMALVSYCAIYLITYFIYLAFLPLNGANINVGWFDIFCGAVLCDLCSGIMPLPGGSGLAEISFDNLMAKWFAKPIFPWAMLIWRILTFFAFILIGGLKVVFSSIKNLCKKQKEKVKK